MSYTRLMCLQSFIKEYIDSIGIILMKLQCKAFKTLVNFILFYKSQQYPEADATSKLAALSESREMLLNMERWVACIHNPLFI